MEFTIYKCFFRRTLLTVFLVSLALRIRYPLGEEPVQARSSACLPL